MQNFEVNGRKVLGFDTGLDSRAFAQAKLARLITEPGLIVRPDRADKSVGESAVELWKPSGVCETSDPNQRQTMIIWGPPVEGERLNDLLNNAPQNIIFRVISTWIQAILLLKNNEFETSLWPCSAMFLQESKGAAIFFAPPSLALREVKDIDTKYVNPGLSGMNAAAFTAAAMLYRVFTGTTPFSAEDKSLLHQDMRDGNFLPIRFAVPGLDARLAALIQNALVPVTTKDGKVTNDSIAAGTALLEEILDFTQKQLASERVLIQPLSQEDQLLLEKEKKQYLKIKTVSVKTKRFVARNAALLAGCLAAIVAVALGAYSCAQSRARLPSTAGMEPVQIIESYYYAIGDLDHQMMEACVRGKAGKNDIRMVINFFVINKTRQSYDINAPPVFISAHKWQEDGKGPTEIPVFGPADLRPEWLGGNEENGEIHYRVNYIFWTPVQFADDGSSVEDAFSEEAESPAIENDLSLPYPRSDLITLIRKKGNWRISDIQRQQ
jgi:hypothetical protein